MSTLQRSAIKASSSAAIRPSPVRASVSRTRCVAVAASKEAGPSRREALGVAIALSAASFSQAAPAFAFLGFGDDDAIKEQYSKTTADILAKVGAVLALARDDPTKDDAVKSLRTDINNWVATYRREPLVAGRPSYGNTYSALNALAGHYNNFGTSAPIPKKRLERLMKELDDATLFLSRGR